MTRNRHIYGPLSLALFVTHYGACIDQYRPSVEQSDSKAPDDDVADALNLDASSLDEGPQTSDAWQLNPMLDARLDDATTADFRSDAGLDMDQRPDVPFDQLPLATLTCEVFSPAEGEVVQTPVLEVVVAGFVEGEPAPNCSARATLFGPNLSDVREDWAPCDDFGQQGLGLGMAYFAFDMPQPGPTRIEVQMLFTVDPPYRPGGYIRYCERRFTVDDAE